MSDRDTLAGYIDTWAASIADFIALLEALQPEDWARPTDLPGWDVRAVASHVAHLESILGGGPHETAEVGDLAHVTSPMGQFTEIGVITRRDTDPAAIVAEIAERTAVRRAELADAPPSDASAAAPGVFGAIGWNIGTLLRNRPLDVWMHEQDIRRAIERPGGMDTPGAQHTADYLSEGFGYVVGKKVKASPGTTAVLEVDGSVPVAVEIDQDGRGRRLDAVPTAPTVGLAMSRETFIVAAGGRRPAQAADIRIDGDPDLGARIVAALATTP